MRPAPNNFHYKFSELCYYSAVMRKLTGIAILAGTLFALTPRVLAEGEGVDVLLHFNSQSAVSFTSSQSSFDLTLPDFSAGSISPTAEVGYSIIANDVGRIQDVVMAHLDVPIDGIALEVRLGSFSSNGEQSHLVSPGSGFVTLNTFDQGVADKVTDAGDGKIVDGNLTLQYRARLTQELPAGPHEATVTVTFVDN